MITEITEHPPAPRVGHLECEFVALLEHGDLPVAFHQELGELGADETTADDHHPLPHRHVLLGELGKDPRVVDQADPTTDTKRETSRQRKLLRRPGGAGAGEQLAEVVAVEDV